MEEKYWNRFTNTGSVKDYLDYRGIAICEQVMRRYEEEENGQGRANTALAAWPSSGGVKQVENCESDYSDRDGAFLSTYR